MDNEDARTLCPYFVTLELPLLLPLADILSVLPPFIDCGGDNVAFLNRSEVRSVLLLASDMIMFAPTGVPYYFILIADCDVLG